MNKLEYIDDFSAALKSYRLSPTAHKMLQEMKFVLLVAPSSSGRNTIIRELLKTGEYHFIVSDTTRKPRENDGVMEQTGREYWFRSEADILADIKDGEFLEAAIIHGQQVSGVSMRELKKGHDDNKICITDIEVDGAAHIHSAKPNAMIIFIVPPSFEVWLERLHQRGKLPEDEVRRRLESAVQEFGIALAADYYTYLVNDELTESIAKVYELTKLGIIDPESQQHGKRTIESLLLDTAAYLKSH